MMTPSPIRVAVTGAAGQIAYSLLFRIASGELFGTSQPIALQLLEHPDVLTALGGVKFELEDCAFPLLREILITTDPEKGFKDADYALLLGASPRGAGMERKDLLERNGHIFITQGKALNEAAKADVKVFVVGNPCNTNCLIALHNAPRLKPTNFYAMTRLDMNRATSMLAEKAGVKVTEVKKVAIWGNHSSTQMPDFFHAEIKEKSAESVIQDRAWLENHFIPAVQKRGAAVIQARGKSSAASAANALLDSIKDTLKPTSQGDWYSLGLFAKDNPYGIDEDLIFSFPVITTSEGVCQIVSNLELNDFLLSKIKLSEKELIEERDLICHLINP